MAPVLSELWKILESLGESSQFLRDPVERDAKSFASTCTSKSTSTASM